MTALLPTNIKTKKGEDASIFYVKQIFNSLINCRHFKLSTLKK